MKHSNISVFIPHIGCKNRCSFCNQHVISGAQHAPSPQEVDRLLREALAVHRGDPLKTEIAFFGGSFTAVPRAYRAALLQTAQHYLEEFGLKGIRISTRPDAITPEILSELKGCRVTAIELGAQSMDDSVLEMNHRGHTARQVRAAAQMIRREKFELGLQMMVGLYGATAASDIASAQELADLHPDTVRIYPTVILPGTELEKRYRAGEYPVMPMEEAVDLCAKLLRLFEDRSIPVIKLGLHASEQVAREMVAGIYHPAFRELCESRVYREQAVSVRVPKMLSKITLQVNPTELSKMIGQKRGNILWLEKHWGRSVRVTGNPALKKYEIQVAEE